MGLGLGVRGYDWCKWHVCVGGVISMLCDVAVALGTEGMMEVDGGQMELMAVGCS